MFFLNLWYILVCAVMWAAAAAYNTVSPLCGRLYFEVAIMETDIDDLIFGGCDPGPSER